jgi:hypothetical protein
MSQSIILKISGLFTYPNNLGKEVPEGALKTATNVVIDAPSVAQTRRGFDRLTAGFSAEGDRARKYFSFQGKLLCSYSGDKLAWYDTATPIWVDYTGTFEQVNSTTKIRSGQANQNLYLTTEAGIYKIATYNVSPTAAGMYKALDINGTLNAASTGFCTDDNQVAYRHLWGIKDANNNIILGAPSQRAVVINNSGTTKDIDLSITIPTGVTTSHFFQVYRSPESGAVDAEPNDELQLVYEASPTSAEITAGSISFTDQTPNSLLGETIYTAPSQQGILQSNEIPPQAKDLTAFQGSMFYADTVSKQRLNLSMLAIGHATTGDITSASDQLTNLASTTGIAAGQLISGVGSPANTTVLSIVSTTVTMSANATDTTAGLVVTFTAPVTIDGDVYTPKHTETPASAQYKVYFEGTPAQNIADTSNSLVRVINKYASNTNVYAYYLSGVDDLPGKMLLEERGFGGSTFAVTTSAFGNIWNPALPSSGTSVSSENDAFENALYFSKNGLPEAVPLVNIFRIGSASAAILRIIALRNSLFVLKEDGIWRILGEDSSNFRIEPVDTSTKLIAPETACTLNNQIYALTDQGVTIITETGVQVISRPIEGDLLELLGKGPTAIRTVSFGIGYETDRKYILFTISEGGDTFATQAYTYNVFTKAWTRWDLSKTTGFVDPASDKLILGEGSSNYTNQERKTFSQTDYVDETDPVTIVSFSGDTVTVSDSTTIDVGDLLYQSAATSSIVLEKNGNILTMQDTITTWTPGSTTLYKAIESVLEWLPNTGGNPGVIKNFQEASVFMRDKRFTSLFLGFKTEVSPSYEEVELTGDGTALWGAFPWGSVTWGSALVPGPIRTYVPLDKSRASELSVRMRAALAFQRFQTQGISIPYENGNFWVTN